MKVIWRRVKYPRIDLREGELVIIAPPGTNVDEVVERNREWIDRNLKMINELKEKARKEVEDKGVRILDEYMEVVHNCRRTGISAGKIYVCKKKREFLKGELKELLRKDIEGRVETYGKILGVLPKRIYIREQKTKWGSCSSIGNLSFNLLLIFLPSEFRDYVVAHEMVHLVHHSHNDDFKNLLNKLNVKIPSKEESLYNWYYGKLCKEKIMM